MSLYNVEKLMVEARKLAADYRKATGKPLGISSEIARFDAARLMKLELIEESSTVGYDAVGKGAREGKLIQIKGRAILDDKKSGQRVGQMKIDQQWDSVMLVMMDDIYEPVEIYEADREDLMEEMEKKTTSKRSKRGAISVAKFKFLGRLVWTNEEGEIDDVNQRDSST